MGANAGPCLETIRIEEGRPLHLGWHQERFERTRRELFGAAEPIDLSDLLRDAPADGVYRCRVLYTLNIKKVEFLPYDLRLPRRIAAVEFVGEYPYKYADRSPFERLRERWEGWDELLLCRRGELRDTTIANIALRQGEQWYTPARPLLEGTQRARLLAEGVLRERRITLDDLGEYEELALMNAMIGFRKLGDPGESITIAREREE
ncbi:aminotransferase class IV [Nitratifractor sp.]